MRARKLLNELMLISPLVFIGCITVHARTRVDGFTPVQYSPVMQDRIRAYVEPVRIVEETLYHGYHNVDARKLREVGELWKRMTREGTLKPLPPEAKDDTTREGVKGQIRRAADELAAALQVLARSEAREGNSAQAAEDAILAMEVVQGLKYSDLYSVGIFCVRQNASLEFIGMISPGLSASTSQRMAGRIEELSDSEKPLAELVFRERRHALASKEAARYPRMLRGQLQLMLDAAKALDKGLDAKSARALSAELGKAARAGMMPPVLSEFRFAWSARRNNLHHVSDVRRDLLREM